KITRALLEELEKMPYYAPNNFLDVIQDVAKNNAQCSKSNFQSLRLLITGKNIGPSLHEICHILGPDSLRQRCLAYLLKYDHSDDLCAEKCKS
ncbi:hypothetical protein HMI56_004253, partial [Coelomomyces lativittatus]